MIYFPALTLPSVHAHTCLYMPVHRAPISTGSMQMPYMSSWEV